MATQVRSDNQLIWRLRDFLKKFKKGCIVKFSNYLDSRTILFLDESDRDKALEKLVGVLYESGKIRDKESFYRAILEREKIVSTGIGMGVAIPHAKLKGFEDFFIAIGIQKKQGLEWDALDKSPVRLIFMIGGPENKQTEYLKILSCLTHVIKDETLRKKMLKISDSLDAIKLLEQY